MNSPPASVFSPPLPEHPAQRRRWRGLTGGAAALALANAALASPGPLVVLTTDSAAAQRLNSELAFYLPSTADIEILQLPDWETLPYDVFSPHQDIVSARLATLCRLPDLVRGVLIVPVASLMVRLAPRSHVADGSLVMAEGERLDLERLRARLEASGYRCVGQVMEHGEFAVRGSLFDLYAMGVEAPLRVDLLDDRIESIRSFDPETQISTGRVGSVRLLPAREFPLDASAIAAFRQRWRAAFAGDPTRCSVYREVSEGAAPAGIEYYLDLFFDQLETLFDYLAPESTVVELGEVHAAAEAFWHETVQRHEQMRHDTERPILEPRRIYLETGELFARMKHLRRVRIGKVAAEVASGDATFQCSAPPRLPVEARASEPLAMLREFLERFAGRALLVAESAGRREILLESLRGARLFPEPVADWQAFRETAAPLAITVAEVADGLVLDEPPLAVITEQQLFGERATQKRQRASGAFDVEHLVRSLAELSAGAPVVHQDHGVGRYRGLQVIETGGVTNEYLCLEYAGGDKLYVPVASLHLVSRYTGAEPEHAPLHKLGTQQWAKAQRKASEKAADVAAELLEIHARRAARAGTRLDVDEEALRSFARGFPFEETPDQASAIDSVVSDMRAGRAMDRLVCGDVGFGKTEVAMRAAFVAVQSGWQVAILVPTTLLAQQHWQTFTDRFADWPVTVAQLSRFRSAKQQDTTLAALAEGRVDIVIGTHKLLRPEVRFKRLGLVVIDEEHRFGVRQKERFKALRAEVDVLTLTATPIPRTLNMALSGLRDLSLIATPPERRLSIRTFVRHWDRPLIREACLREIHRGGQIYLVHNKVENIERIAREVAELVPEARVRVAHGQMRERELEQVMLDFYHGRFNLLVCTTIIETGIDVPNANTIIINRADHFGLAQLHQLRGRVGRSHHRAYAYLLAPPSKAMTEDARKRLAAIETLEDLGIGFTLATHDLEIRGAGEILGDEQSGQIHEVGYALYSELLQRAVQALKAGRSPQLDRPLDHGTEVDLQTPALIPADYLPDVHARLVMYKRIASADSDAELDALRAEMIDRFGALPEAARTLFRVTALKLRATPLGIRKIEVGARGGRVLFSNDAAVEPDSVIRLLQREPRVYRLEGGDRLRLDLALPDTDARIAALDRLLSGLSVRNAA